MTDLVNRAAVVVQRYGGTVGSFTGDGIMAVFGAPTALEDHAFRACLAALGYKRRRSGLPSTSESATVWSCSSCGGHSHCRLQFDQGPLSQRYQLLDVGRHVAARNVADPDVVGI